MPAPSIFISHSNKDNAWCRPFRQALVAAGYDVWYDEQDMPLGKPFPQAIGDQIDARPIFVVILTPDAWESHWVQTEINTALAARKFIVPVIQRDITVKGLLQSYERINAVALAPAETAQRVVQRLAHAFAPAASPSALPGEPLPILASFRALGFVARKINGVEVILPPTVEVPAGEFLMGSNKVKDPWADDDELPQQVTDVPAFRMGTYPVTVAEYAKYLAANPSVAVPPDSTFLDDERVTPEWRGKALTWAIQQQEHGDHPVVLVDWQNATNYAAWLAQVTGQLWRLPTEAEWEKAARGPDGRIYPWGLKWEQGWANVLKNGPGMTTPIGTYAAKDMTPYGCHDMIGNVWEWCNSLYLPYPYNGIKSEDTNNHNNKYIIRGGSWLFAPLFARAACRLRDSSGERTVNLGFRLARDPGPGSH